MPERKPERKPTSHYIGKIITDIVSNKHSNKDSLKKIVPTPINSRIPTPGNNTERITQIPNPIATSPLKKGGTHRRKSKKNKSKRRNNV
jgi:hypothetical protein